MNSCMVAHAKPEEEDRAREEWFAGREERRREREKKERDVERRRREFLEVVRKGEDDRVREREKD